tara:strand:- start:19207 stop:19692 length:486 start_codon:yes stop_codon:yes gene_type:complete
MNNIPQKNWITGSGDNIDFYELLKILKQHVSHGSRIFIGSDSFNSQKKTCFATAVCLHGGDLGARYFFFKENINKHKFANLVSRITEETRRSIEVASMLIQEYKFNVSNIELHLDVSPVSAGQGTSRFSDMLSGYVQGYGLGFRLKPDAWASQSVADKHSK